ncbi:transglutaminase-like domain-containing protein [Planococcus sp. YIM B11945]|uniref:transglutaminase-like domain-containing protein n=1 Tax=Planococcus sp. YIM B11945 TaxID=3435410 RepID=UPI003D7EF4B1
MIKENSVIYQYRYTNRQSANVQIWLAVPPSTKGQKVKQIKTLTAPLNKSKLYRQELWFYDLEPGESGGFEASLDLAASKLPEQKPVHELEESERQFYLRSAIMSPATEELAAEARTIIGEAHEDLDIAKRLFEYFLQTFSYKYPPKKRGALFFREAKKGDCGEFSFLYTSYMRSLGIPCRTVVGAFAKKFRPHAWNEVWIEGRGWIQVDTSMPASLKKPISYLTLPLQLGESTNKGDYFGNFDGNRVIFCLDADWPLFPDYHDVLREQPKELFVFGKEIEYGFQSLEGTAPYMQPIYSRFTKDIEPGGMTDLLGRWNIKETDKTRKFLSGIKQYMYYVFFVAMFASAIGALTNAGFLERLPLIEIGYGAAMLGLLAAILRKEANWAVYLVTAATVAIVIQLFLN